MLSHANRLLAAFGQDLELCRPDLREVTLRSGQVLCEPGERIRYVYFLHAGAVSKLAVFSDGSEIECALVGREGAVGAMSVLGLGTSVTRDVCHFTVTASRLNADRLAQVCRVSQRVHDVLDRYGAWRMSCAIHNGACNGRHPVDRRLCRWLLTCSDVLERTDIPLSQDIFARMLGVQRTSISPTLQKLRAEGLVSLGRGRVVILDRGRLRGRACECYAAMRAAGELLLPWAPDVFRPPSGRGHQNLAI